MKTLKRILISAVLALGAGCSITETVQSVPSATTPTICIVEDPKVRPVVLETYRQTLEDIGYAVRVSADASPADCPVVSTYTARWSWDLTTYLGYARISVFQDGRTIGETVYDVGMSASDTRFVDPAAKIRQLVIHLFPRRL